VEMKLRLLGKGKRGRATAKPDMDCSTRKEDEVVVLKMRCEKSLEKIVQHAFCQNLINNAKEFFNNGPATPKALVSVLAPATLDNLYLFITGPACDKNGGRAMMQIIPYFIEQQSELQSLIRDADATKTVVEDVWNYKYSELFMSEQGSIMTSNLKKAVEERRKELRDHAAEVQRVERVHAQAVPQVFQNFVQNPAAFMQFLNDNPNMAQALANAIPAVPAVPFLDGMEN